MTGELFIRNILPTVFIKKEKSGLKQLVRIEVVSLTARAVQLMVIEGENRQEISLGILPPGESMQEIFMNELEKETKVEFILKSEGVAFDQKTIPWIPPRHWLVHVVQLSHHDPGYTDIPSNVLKDHCRWLDQAIDMAGETDVLAEDAKFRIVIEQAWSIDHYLKHTPAERAEKAVKLIREGRFEVTSLFGNMTSELCGHEVLARSLYHSFKLKRKYGFDIVSAEHNDITGISWGLSRVLTDAGIKIFCPGIPLYYNWGHGGIPSFWDQSAIFRHEGPGAFWWEAPSGKRILFWCNNSGCGGDVRGSLPGLAEKLSELENMRVSAGRAYPYSVLRWPVGGGARDNSPYIIDYAYTVQQWNEKWVFPHLVCSTNARFYSDFIRELPDDLPILRGELAGQDYPVASTSTAAATAANRNNHCSLPAAEKLAAAAVMAAGHIYPEEELYEAYEDTLWYDEHAWGYHFPCGPAMKASEYEKAVHAYRASAVAHGVIQKAMARIADQVKIEDGDNEGEGDKAENFHLVVFNTTQYARTGPVHALLREIDNSGSVMYKVPKEEDPIASGYLRGVLLNDRWHANPPMELVEGFFDLIDAETGKAVPFQIIEVKSAMDAVPYAAERLGIGSGTRRYGFFEEPLGLKRELCFIAAEVPGYGYKTYRLRSRDKASFTTISKLEPKNESLSCSEKKSVESLLTSFKEDNESFIENEYYRVCVDRKTGAVSSIYDKSATRELVDEDSPHGFNTVVVRDINPRQEMATKCSKVEVRIKGPVCAAIEVVTSVYGHPAICQTIRLYAGIRQVYLDTRVLKDATPLLNTHMAFPFKAVCPEFRYEGALAVMHPIRDYLPGSHSDTIAVQNWVKVMDNGGSPDNKDKNFNILWSSPDSPVASFGRLWPGYTSPAHRCCFDPETVHAPLKEEDMDKGWIYSTIFSNNYGTNFSVSQTGDVLFRYILTSCEGEISDARAAAFGWQAVTPFEPIYTKHKRQGTLPIKSSFMEINNENILLLTCKQAEDGEDYILRLWNMDSAVQAANVQVNYIRIGGVRLANIAEEDTGGQWEYNDRSFALKMEGNSVITIRIVKL